MTYHVYIIECSDKTFYTGITTDIVQRLDEHNAGKGAKYTRCRRPVVLKASRCVATRSIALKLEAFVKRKQKKMKEKALFDWCSIHFIEHGKEKCSD